MKIVITQWALDSYLNLKNDRAFSQYEYRLIIRPDIMLLEKYPDDPKFSQNKFWSVAQGLGGKIIANGFKMKWHQVGAGRTQLRATIGILHDKCFLCEAYIKHDDKQDKRKLARFKTILQLIRQDSYVICGRLS